MSRLIQSPFIGAGSIGVGLTASRTSGGGADPAATLPTLSGTFEQWDTTSGLAVDAWTGRKQGLVLPAIGTPTIVSNSLNGRAGARCILGNLYSGAVNPLGNGSAFSLWGLARVTADMNTDGGANGHVIATATNADDSSSVELVFYRDSTDADVPYSAEPEVDNSAGLSFFPAYNNASGAVHLAAGDVVLLELILDSLSTVPRFYANGIPLILSGDSSQENSGMDAFGFTTFSIGDYDDPDSGTTLDECAFLVGAASYALTLSDRQKNFNYITAVYGLTLPAAS